jgi:hypothetical protein
LKLRHLIKFYCLSFPDKILLLEALFWLPICRAVIQWVPMRLYTSVFLGKQMRTAPSHKTDEQQNWVAPVSWAVQTVDWFMPWKNKCFATAMAAKTMLRFRRIRSTLYLGVKKDLPDEIQAHAWLRCGDVIVTGGDGKAYKVVSAFV